MADTSGKGKKRKSYSLEFKLKAIEEASITSGEATARKYGIHPRRIREWRTQKLQLQSLSTASSSTSISCNQSYSVEQQPKIEQELTGT